MACAKIVTYNTGREELEAIVIKGKVAAGSSLNLFVPETLQVVKDVPNRSKADYGAEGGGRTWYD